MPLKTLVVYGNVKDQTPDSVTYELESSNRGEDNKHDVALDDKSKQFEFVFADGTRWITDPDSFHELYPEADAAIQPAGQRGADSTSFELPPAIKAPGADRGIFGSIALAALKVFTKQAVPEGIGAIAKKLESKLLKHGIPEDSSIWADGFGEEYLTMGAGIFRIDDQFAFSKFDGKPSNDPFFLFIHGTNSDTLGAYADLKNAVAWTTLHAKYKKNVIAFQHRTLTESPLENAVKLANMLPDNANLHIISHSRGGIVGDIMCMYSTVSGASPLGFSNENIELLKKEGNRDRDIESIKALNKIFKTKKITVTKFIRVACPAAGTKLASKRLDHILNVFFNLANLVGGELNPFVDILKELVTATVTTKDNVNVLPGLEAQSPASPFMKILNDQADKTAIDGGSLMVISGNGTVSFSGNGLMVILGKLFYTQRNDLVVNTDSMYLGAKRKNNIQYFFDQGNDVNHVKYFANPQTRDAINLALITAEGADIPGFKSIPQNEIPGSDRDDRGLDHGELFPIPGLPGGNKPIVVLLPGIMGSNLSRTGNKLWLNYVSSVFGGLIDLEFAEDNSIAPSSVIKSSYNKLVSRLSSTYDVVIYPFDWRKQLNDCAKEFDAKIRSLLQFDRPIKIIGHSMGGVLVRDFIINYDDTWKKLNASKGFRLLFLGSPLGGSFRIPTVLFGQDGIINALDMLDRVHTKKELLEMFSRFPGILSLLPLTTDADNDYGKPAVWEKMRDVMGDDKWPLPEEDDLKVFTAYRDNILTKRDSIDYSNMVYIAGKDKQTPCGYYKDEISPRRELVFLYTGEGDQSVTWELGIPKQMTDAGNVYYVPVTHGELANEPEIFDGIEEILLTGATARLKKTKPLTRGDEKVFRGQPSFNFDFSQRGLENAIAGIDERKEPITSRVPVTVSVSNGDLCYASYPVLAGHFLNDGILYAEKIINKYLNGVLDAKHRLGLYPGDVGTNDVFGKNEENNFAGAIIVGLGEPGSLTSFQLARTVEQGVSNYLLSIRGKSSLKDGIGISALMIGCGYGGLTVESSLKAIIEGVNNANEKATSIFKNNSKTVQHIEFVEVYANKSLSCMYALNKIVNKENSSYNIIIGSKRIKNLLGIKKRIPLDTSEEWWNRITVKYKAPLSSGEPSSMVFGASTGDSREEENELYSSTPLIDLFIAEVSTKNQWSGSAAKTLFELMIPNDLKEKLKRKGNISWILDGNTASYPWELLQDDTINAKPLCINAGMIRQLSTSDYRINIKRVAEDRALIIADPVLNDFITQLPGAREEGHAVEDALKNAGYPTTSIIYKDASEIVRSFFSDDYTIIHMAGHGVFNANSPKKSGMVIGKDVFLTVFDIQQMPVVPDLVFVNCCHLGKVTSVNEKYYEDRYKLAANIGTELIRIGVKAVIAAGWAVNDAAALDFATQFYTFMFMGDSFGDAVKKARNYVYEKHQGNNTWGAYQCYGDPFFKLRNTAKATSIWSPSYIVPEEAETDLENLYNQLQMSQTTSSNNAITTEDNLADLKKIVAAIDTAGISNASTIEKQALIYLELAMYKDALAKFEELMVLENAAFSFSCMEKYCNTGAKLYIREYFDDIDPKEKALLPQRMDVLLDNLTVLLNTGATAERLNLMGSTHKRKAMLEEDKTKRENEYKFAAACYEDAAKMECNANITYSIVNAIELGCILDVCGAAPAGSKFVVYNGQKPTTYKVRTKDEAKTDLLKLRDAIQKDDKQDLDYWDMVASINIDLCLLMMGEKTSPDRDDWTEIIQAFNKTWQKAGSAGKKAAELEHLQFLTYALTSAKKPAGGAKPDIKKGPDDLASWMVALRTAYNTATGEAKADSNGQPRKRKPSTAKKAARKTKKTPES